MQDHIGLADGLNGAKGEQPRVTRARTNEPDGTGVDALHGRRITPS
jgi:hypothetical protein